MFHNEKKHLDTRKNTDFIPHHIAPDNWLYFGERANPLSSKGSIETSDDYDDYEDQYYDYREVEEKDDYFYDE